MIVRLERLDSSTAGTFGRLITPGFDTLSTCERPWLDNRSGVSCIPVGVYNVEMTYSPRFKRRMYLLLGTGKREGIRIHPANTPRQLQGCIALGEKVGWLGREKAVLLSRPAVRRFESFMGGEPFQLEIV